MFDEQEAMRLLKKALAQLVVNQPFFGNLSLALTFKAETDLPFPTMSTDGRYLYFHPDFVGRFKAPVDLPKLIASVCHEVMHCAMCHMTRLAVKLRERDMCALVACDLSINPVIRNAKMQLPETAVFPAQFGLQEGLSAEEYYHLLRKMVDEYERELEQQSGGSGPGKGKGGHGRAIEEWFEQHDGAPSGHCAGPQPPTKSGNGEGEDEGEGEDGENEHEGCWHNPMNRVLDQNEIAKLEADWTIAVKQAAKVAKDVGRLPAELQRLVEDLTEPKLDWRDLLKRFLVERSRDDYRMFPPNRRYLWNHLFMPSISDDGNMGEIVIVADTSGSIGQVELRVFASEINGICNELRPTKVHVIGCDSRVAGHQVFTPDEYPIALPELQKAMRGGGGTNFLPPFRYLEQEAIEPVCLIYLTDMYGCGWPEEQEFPVLWVATTDVVAPMGETIRLTVE